MKRDISQPMVRPGGTYEQSMSSHGIGEIVFVLSSRFHLLVTTATNLPGTRAELGPAFPDGIQSCPQTAALNTLLALKPGNGARNHYITRGDCCDNGYAHRNRRNQ
ncbi:MAG: hypothetical protein RPU52_03835 [Candidatus Sedimenticola sp. (ex Thyasira tokunagai)]